MGKLMVFSKLLTACGEHRNEIALATGFVSFGASIVMAIDGGMKAGREIDFIEEKTKLEKKEKAKIIAKHQWKTALTALFAGYCTLEVFIDQKKTIAGLVGAATVYESVISDNNKIFENLDSKKVEEAKKEVIQEKLNNSNVTDDTIINTGNGTELCYDLLSNTFFLGDHNYLEHKIIPAIDDMVRHNTNGVGYICMSELYDMIGLRGRTRKSSTINDNTIEIGKIFGWYCDDFPSDDINKHIEYDIEGYEMIVNGKEELVWVMEPKWYCMPNRMPNY